MAKSLKRVALDFETLKEIDFHRNKLKKIGLVDPRLLSDNKIIKFMNEKAKRNPRNIPLDEILKILQG